MGDERGTRERVLDAALEIVAERGLQALTHRGVERHAEVSHGLTTYYFRSREALIDALLQHIGERQIAWITRLYAELAHQARDDPAGPDRETFVRRVVEAMTAERTLTLARYELYLHAARHPHLQEVVARVRAQHVAIQARMFAAIGAPEPELAAHRLLSATEGLLLYQLSVPEADFDRWAAPYLLLITDALAGFAPEGDTEREERR